MPTEPRFETDLKVKLATTLARTVEHAGADGWRIVIDARVQMDGAVVSPDIAGWRRERLPELPDTRPVFTVMPDWVCEVQTDATARHTRLHRLPLYARHGVGWVWLLDVDSRLLDVHVTRDGVWSLCATFDLEHPFAAVPFAAVTLDRNAWRPEPEPAPDESGAVDTAQAAVDEFDRGRSFHKDRDFASAIRSFQRVVKLDATHAEGAFRLGLAYEDDRQFRLAIEAYEACLVLKPDHVQAACNIGEAHRKNERYAEAIKAYDRALRIKSDYLYALAGRGESMRMLGDCEGSLVWFDNALALGPKHAFAMQGKAASLNARRRFAEALPLWESALDIDARSQFALDGKAYCKSQLDRAPK